MVNNMTEQGNQFELYLDEQLRKRGWSMRTLAMYLETSPSTISYWRRGITQPGTEAIRKLAELFGEDESYLFRLTGHMEETRHALNDPAVLAMAYRLEDLTPDARMRTIQALDAMIGATRASAIPDDAKQARIRELKAAIRAAQEYLESLERDE